MDKDNSKPLVKKKYTDTKGPGSKVETPYKHGDVRIKKLPKL